MKHVYVVTGSQGSYSDRMTWVSAVFEQKKDAQDYVDRCMGGMAELLAKQEDDDRADPTPSELAAVDPRHPYAAAEWYTHLNEPLSYAMLRIPLNPVTEEEKSD